MEAMSHKAYGLFSIDKDLSLTNKSQRDIFDVENPYSLETQASAHTQFLDESYDMLIDVTLRRRNVPIVTLDVSISNEAVSPADTVILRSVTSTVPSDYIIRNIWIEHSTVASAIRAKGWDVPSASGVAPKLRFRISAGAAAPLLAQDEVDQSVYIQRNMKLISSTPNFLYGENIVSFGRTELFKFITDLNAFAIKPGSAFLDDSTTAAPSDGYGFLRINDGSAPYGGTYGPHQGSHGNGLSLDLKPFGNRELGESYDVIRTTDSRSPRYDDILAVLQYSKLQKNPLDATEYMWSEGECDLVARDDSSVKCEQVLTVEKCLYQIEPTNPPAGVALNKCDQSVRPMDAATRLEKWVRHNRNGIGKLISSSKSRSLHLSAGQGWNASLRQTLDIGTPYKGFFSDDGVQRNLLEDGMLPNGFMLHRSLNDGTFSKLSDNEVVNGLNFAPDNGHYNHIHINSIVPIGQ
ncbi:MAG: hypothetical protein JNJ49_07975 [Bdellovibrionaceae bacterium]|nr:hypothetical protein [Pseudobdellovibrionaceae bacterium]